MLKVHDGRKKNESRLWELEHGKFFMWNDCVLRLVNVENFSGLIATEDMDELVAMLMTTGELTAINRNTWVEPIPDKQIYLEIED